MLEPTLPPKCAKWGPRCPLSWRTWRQDTTKLANLEPQMTLLRGARAICVDRGRDLIKNWQTQKTNDSTAIWKDFGMLEGLVGPSRSHCLLILMLSWAMLGHLGIILRQHSDKMRQSWDQDEVQDRQDVPAWSARRSLERVRRGGGAGRRDPISPPHTPPLLSSREPMNRTKTPPKSWRFPEHAI